MAGQFDPDDTNDPPLNPEQQAEDEAVARRISEAEEYLKDLESVGWRWQTVDGTRLLVHPHDPECHIFYNPFSGEQLLSPKLVQRIQDDVRRERGKAPGQRGILSIGSIPLSLPGARLKRGAGRPPAV